MPRPASAWTTRRIALALAAVAGLAVLATIADPGITVDEPLDVRPGRNYVATLLAKGAGFFDRGTVDRVFLDNKEHPPLGRWLLGVASTLGQPLETLRYGPDPTGTYVISGRVAPALVFALLVGLIASEAGRLFGRAGAFAAGFATLVMPRVFGHAHLGALDTFIAFFWCLALIAAERALESSRPARGMALAGLAWGLALLTKIHAWLLPPLVLIRAFVRPGPRRAILPLTLWAAVALSVFLIGWPWLWFDTVARLRGFLGTGVERTVISVQYFGRVYRDRDVPWHFPWIYFLATVPVGLHLFGFVGLVGAIRKREIACLTYSGAIAFVLLLFSTNVPVYDGERLYLMVFPLWAIVVGRGFSRIWARFNSASGAETPHPNPLAQAAKKPDGDAPEDLAFDRARQPGPKPFARWVLTAFLLVQSAGLVLHHPCHLSYYNLLVGGLPGAGQLGLELAYWGESVDRPLLRALAVRLRPGESASLAPTLAPNQGVFASGRALLARKTFLADQEMAAAADYLVIYRRDAYLKPEIVQMMEDGELVAETRRLGVWLARVVRRGKPAVSPGQSAANP